MELAANYRGTVTYSSQLAELSGHSDHPPPAPHLIQRPRRLAMPSFKHLGLAAIRQASIHIRRHAPMILCNEASSRPTVFSTKRATAFATLVLLPILSLRPCSAEQAIHLVETPSSRHPANQVSLSPEKAEEALVAEVASIIEQQPVSTERFSDNLVFLDFGRVAFGNLQITTGDDAEGTLVVRFGEKLDANGKIDRTPPGTVRYSEVKVDATPGKRLIVAPPADQRNTQQASRPGRFDTIAPPAVLTPADWGVVTPFRWVEIEGAAIDLSQVSRRAAFPNDWNDAASSFTCSDETLNQIWNLCRYSIKATLFTGIYIDGDRERIPYEADAYLNQLSDFYTNGSPDASRRTFDRLVKYPTWPSEWPPHMVFMAHADWMHFGDLRWLSGQYDSLKDKLLLERCDDSGLARSNERQIEWNDIVDWPPQERDGFIRSDVNTVVNAFHLAAVAKMVDLAEAVGDHSGMQQYTDHLRIARESFRQELFDPEAGLYRDGPGIDHYSSHANFFPLAFGLVEPRDRAAITDWLVSRGMRCSVYGAQYLLESLFNNDRGKAAVDMMIAPGDRSWRHMLESDATITWEAWNEGAKTNLDWNHAWGAAPANLLPRYVLGAAPISPGWRRAKIQPHVSGLTHARGIVPTHHGPISIDWRCEDSFVMQLELPEGIAASIRVPATPDSTHVSVNAEIIDAELSNGYWILPNDLTGKLSIQVH